MEGILALVVLVIVLALAVQYWYITLGLAIIGATAYFMIREHKKVVAREQAEEAWRRQREAQQNSIHTNLVALCTRSLNAFEAMPTYLLDAETLLDQAEIDFKDEAFAPFWDSVQKATMRLGHFDDGVRQITNDAKTHGELTKTLFDLVSPSFPIVVGSVRGMAAAHTTAARFRTIVRTAQCDFHFAMIYEQRKTNQLLIAGFQNLAQAIDGLGDRITSSIDTLSSQMSEVSSSLTSLNESSRG